VFASQRHDLFDDRRRRITGQQGREDVLILVSEMLRQLLIQEPLDGREFGGSIERPLAGKQASETLDAVRENFVIGGGNQQVLETLLFGTHAAGSVIVGRFGLRGLASLWCVHCNPRSEVNDTRYTLNLKPVITTRNWSQFPVGQLAGSELLLRDHVGDDIGATLVSDGCGAGGYGPVKSNSFAVPFWPRNWYLIVPPVGCQALPC